MMNSNRIVWSMVVLLGMMGTETSAQTVRPSFKNTIRGLNHYRSGLTAVKRRDYRKGIERLTEVVDTYPGARWQDAAHYWLAYAHLAHDNPKRNIEKAQSLFRRLLRDFPTTRYRWEAENYLKLIEEVLQPRREVKRIKEGMMKE